MKSHTKFLSTHGKANGASSTQGRGPKRDRLIFGSQNHRLENLKTQSILFSINLIENIINAISHCQSAAQL